MEITVNGTTYNDLAYNASTNPNGLANGGWRQNNNLIQMLLDVLADASSPLLDTSESSLAIGTGSKAFTLVDNRPIPEGVFVLAIDAGNSDNWMFGQVSDHTGAVLTVNVTLTNGSDTIADWTIQPSSPRGPAGAEYWNTPRVVTNSDSPVAVLDRDIILVRSSTGAVELDAPATGRFKVEDVDGSAPTNNITVDPPTGETIMDGSADETMLIDLAWFSGTFTRRPSGTNWSVG